VHCIDCVALYTRLRHRLMLPLMLDTLGGGSVSRRIVIGWVTANSVSQNSDYEHNAYNVVGAIIQESLANAR